MAWGQDLGGIPALPNPKGSLCARSVPRCTWVLVLPLGCLLHQLAADFTLLDDAFCWHRPNKTLCFLTNVLEWAACASSPDPKLFSPLHLLIPWSPSPLGPCHWRMTYQSRSANRGTFQRVLLFSFPNTHKHVNMNEKEWAFSVIIATEINMPLSYGKIKVCVSKQLGYL